MISYFLKRGTLSRLLWTLGAMATLSLLNSCGDRSNSGAPQYDPRFAPLVQTPKKPISRTPTSSASGRSIRLEPAKDRILGLHVPSNFKLKRRQTSDAYGEVIAKTRNLKAFYHSLGYQIVDQQVGLRLFPSSRSIEGLGPIDKGIARKSYINLVRGKNLTWMLHIHAPPPRVPAKKRPDSMNFILEKLNKMPQRTERTANEPENDGLQNSKTRTTNTTRPVSTRSSKETKKPNNKRILRRPEKTRVHIMPRKSINMRPSMRQWNKNNPQQPFLD